MSIPVLDEQFLPRLICVFYAIFHPTEGPKVIFQVPEGSISDQRLEEKPKSASHAREARADFLPGTSGQPNKPPGEASTSTGKGQLGTGEPLFDFSSLSEYLIPKAPLCGRLVACTARGARRARLRPAHRDASPRSTSPSPTDRSASPRSELGSSAWSSSSILGRRGAWSPPAKGTATSSRTYKILGNPILIEDAARYRRNNFIFNLCFVFEGHADVRAYEPVVRKCGRVLRSLEESQSFLSNPKSMQRVYGIIEQLYEDLNSYCESFVALPEAPYTSYINAASPQALNKLSSPMMGPNDFISLGASAASLRDEHQRKVLAQHLRHMQGSPSRSFEADPRVAAQTPVLARSRAPSDTDSPRSVLSPLTSIHPEHLRRTSSVGEADTAVASSPRSPEAILSMLPPRSRRPTVSRSATLSAIAGFGNGSSSGNGAAPSPTSSMAKSSSEARFTAFGRVSAEEQSELAKELMASEGAGAGSVAPGDPAIADQVNGALSARRSSGGSTGNSASGGDNGQMIDSVVSLRTIDAALSNSISALRHGTSGTTLKSGIAERREPPHGLGRTVRDAVNLKLFPTYPNPPPFNDWDVPVALLDLGSRVDGNWDLTMARIFPFIDGVNHVKRISQLADAELGLTRSCIEHLLYYGCIIMIDIFQYFNMYTVRPAIARMADDVAMGRECAAYVTRPGYPLPSYPELLRLYSLLRPGKNLHEWIEDNDVDAKGVDVRRFVSFGVIQGFLRRVHRYPVYLAPEAAGTEDGESRLEASGLSSTVRDSPMFKSVESPSRMMRDPSGSREPRDRRPRELTGSAIGSSGSGRVLKDGHVGSGVGGQQERSRTPQRRTASDFVTNAGSTHASETSRTTERLGVSPTKKHSSRLRQRAAYHHPTATVIDVASVAFDIRDSTKQTPAPAPRSPRKRVSSQNVGLGLGGISGLGSANAGVGASGISHSQRSVVVIPPELPAMLDGSHCDDELCVRFGIGWPDLEKMLIHLGTGRGSGTRLHGTDDSDDEGVTASGYRGTDWRRSVAGGGGASSGWSRAAKMSGISSGIYHQARSGGAGGGSGGESGSNAASRIYSERALGHNDSSILAHSGQAGGSASGWGAGSEDAGGPGWSGFGGLEKQAIEAGDLGRVKVLLQ